MKRLLLVALTMMAGIAVRAQQGNIMIGAGLFGETGDQARNLFPGAVLRLSYGLDVQVGEKWSVMPGAGIRTQLGNVNMIGSVGGDMEGIPAIRGTIRRSSCDGTSVCSPASSSSAGSIGNGASRQASACGTCCASIPDTASAAQSTCTT